MNYNNCVIYSVSSGRFDEFYVETSCGCSYYLFTARHCGSVHAFFENGRYYEKATDFSLAKRNRRLCDVMERIPSAVRYIFKEYMCA